MKKEFSWPKKGDNPFLVEFADPSSSTWASLQWLSSFHIDDSFYAIAFKEAADKIVKELLKGEDTKKPDMFFMPIAYLYRHCLELKLKQIIRLGIRLRLIEESKKIKDSLGKHSLHLLWNHVRKILEKYWPDGPKEDLNATGNIIQKFHNVDKSGQGLRYSADSSGNKTIKKFPESVQLTQMQKVLDAAFSFLDGCEAALDDALGILSDIY